MQNVVTPTAAAADDDLWQLYNENSKLHRHSGHISDEIVIQRMREFPARLRAESLGDISLSELRSDHCTDLARLLAKRRSGIENLDKAMNMATLANLLLVACGPTYDGVKEGYPRSFRAYPSAGALYPIEIFIWARDIVGMPSGLHYLDVEQESLRILSRREGQNLKDAFTQLTVVSAAKCFVFLTACFKRSTFKYGERGYRFALLEAGHIAQNIMLAALSYDRRSTPIGGYFDRIVDRALGIDGVDQSTVYSVAVY